MTISMRRGRLLGALAVAAGAGAVAGVAGAPAAGGAHGAPEVVMSGLDNPRDLAFGPDGALYVTEAGVGGTVPCFTTEGGPTLAGPTGAVSRLKDGRQQRVVRNLPSSAAPGGIGATGPHGISFHGRRAAVTIGLGVDPSARADACGAAGPAFGKVLFLAPDRERGAVLDVRTDRGPVDVSAHAAPANPGGGVPDSNPYGVLSAGGATFVADAGANTLLRIDRSGTVSTVATFPSRASGRGTDAVPTSVVRGHGALYVGELTGFPFAAGAANVYRVVPGEEPQVHLDGLTAVIDLAGGRRGDLYVLELATGNGLEGPGRLSRVAPDGTRTTIAEKGLVAPTAVTIGEDGAAYIANCGPFPGAGEARCTGQVLRIPGVDR